MIMSHLLELLALPIRHQPHPLHLNDHILQKVQIYLPVEAPSEEIARQIHLQQTHRQLLVRAQHHVPSHQRHVRTELRVRRLHQMQDVAYIGNDRARHGYLPVGMVRHVVILAPPRTSSGEALVRPEPVPVRVRRPSQDLPRLDVDVEEYRVVVGRGVPSARAEDAAQRRDVLRLALLRNVDRAPGLGDDPERAQRSVRGKVLVHPIPVRYSFLYDPIPPVGGILIKVYSQPPLLVPMLDDDCGGVEVRRHGHAALRPLLQKGPLVLHLVPRGNVVQEGVHSRDATVQPPVAEPIVRRQQPDRVLLRDARFAAGLDPEVKCGDGAHDGTRRAHEAECHGTVPHEEAQRQAGAGYGDVGEVIDDVLPVASLAVVRLVVQVEGRR
mmetsp:Transcript_4885/g.12257  ORF Transcript_4885/g.12257 Transcript_4885/m.12257 type:complete len:383 (+) Transcript_4885:173-1321(+)